jgi:hypothetical protein
MKDALLDLIQHTHGLGAINLIKIVGTNKETQLCGVGEGNCVIVGGKFKNMIPEFEGTFGMPNLDNLKTILGFDDYDENATISVVSETKDGVSVPSTIHFETQTGDFVNDYRLMDKTLADAQVPNLSSKVAFKWEFEFEPSQASITRLKKQNSANSTELQVTVSTVKGDLKMSFGDPSTHSGAFVFQPKVGGVLGRSWMFPIKVILPILELVGDKKMKMSNQGVAEITVDSGIAVYSYQLPAQSK